MKDPNQLAEHNAQKDLEEVNLQTKNSLESDFFDQMRKSQIESDIENTSSFEFDRGNEAISVTEGQESSKTSENTYSDMPHEARRALVVLLRHGAILHSQKARLFELLCRHQSIVRRHLAEVYLKLVLDEKAGIAFVSIIQSEEGFESDDFEQEDAVCLINRRTLSLYDTLLLLVLRKHYQERETTGEQVIVIDIERIESYLVPFIPLTNNSKSDRKQLDRSLVKMAEKKVLRKVPGSEERYEITPVIRYVVNADFLESMLSEYLRLAEENGAEFNGNNIEINEQTGDKND